MKNKNELINIIARSRNSIYFRLLCVLYALIVSFLTINPFFQSWCYALFVSLYFIAYVKLRKKDARLRLINDYLLIVLITYGQPVDSLAIIVFLLLPLFNAVNFSGHKKNSYVLFTCFILAYCILLIPHQKLSFIHILTSLIAFIALFFIDYYSSIRWKLNILSQKISDRIDDSFSAMENPHLIYSKVISDINEFLGYNTVENIFCFMLDKNNKFQIINSSVFIFDFLLDTNEVKEELSENEIMFNIQFKYDEISSIYNVAYPINLVGKGANSTYLFIITLNMELSWHYKLTGFFFLIEPFFQRLAKIILIDKQLKDANRETLKKIRDKATFVDQAVNTMHFIRNRLTPYKTLIELLDAKNKSTKVMEIEIDKMITKQTKRAKIELNEIIKKANYLLEKNNNPFLCMDSSYFSFIHFYLQVKRIWVESFDEYSFVTTLINIDSIENYNIYSNFEFLDILISDWITNMYKYKNEYINCAIQVENQEENTVMNLIFKNDYFCSEQNVKELIDDLNNNDRQQILRRTTRGIYSMKEIMQKLDITHNAYRISEKGNNILVFELNINLQNKQAIDE